MRVFLHAIFEQLLLNSYVFWRGYQTLSPKKKYRRPFTIVFALEMSLYLIGYFFHKEIPDSFLLPILMICNTWYIALIYTSLGLLLIDFLRVTNRIRPWFPSFINNHPQKVNNIFFGVFLASISILLIYGYQQVKNPVVKHVHIQIPKNTVGREKLTIAMMSDMHLGETIGKTQLQHYVRLCNEQQPDMILIPGDVIDYESRFAEQMQMEEEFRQLKAPLGVYITLGNHEYRANKDAKMRWFEKTGCILLVDSVVMPDSGFYLIGRDDAINLRRSSLHALMNDLLPEKPSIVVDHRPDFINEIVMNNADLGLHGHTHNGQLWPNSIRLKLLHACSYGYYKKGNTQFYVSSGIGCSGAPFRVGTQSELVILHITFRENT